MTKEPSAATRGIVGVGVALTRALEESSFCIHALVQQNKAVTPEPFVLPFLLFPDILFIFLKAHSLRAAYRHN